MQMKFFLYEEAKKLQFEMPDIVRAYENQDYSFIEKVKTWLSAVEDLLKKYQMAEVSNISSLKGTLISVERGLIPSDILFKGRSTPKKIRQASALKIANDVNNILNEMVGAFNLKLNEAVTLARQLFAIASQKGLLAKFESIQDLNVKQKAIISVINNDPELNPWIVKLNSIMGIYESQIILDKTLSEFI